MKAVQYKKYGGPEVLEIVEIDKPDIKSHQFLVEVYAASINPFDFKVRSGKIPGMPDRFPITIGGDYSGIVKQVGPDVTEFHVGDEVYGQASYFGGASGSFAQFTTAFEKNSCLKPNNLKFTEAASLPLTGISAVQALEDHIGLQKGQTILIHGGTGGIGSVAIQIAKHIGAKVVTTVSTDNIEAAKALGADEVIDYKKQHFEEVVRGVDAVFNTAGGKETEQSFSVVKKGGIVVSMTSSFDAGLAEKYGAVAIAQNSQTTSERLSHLKDYVEKGVVTPQIDQVFDLQDVQKAFKYQEEDHPKGKVVIKIQ